MEEDTLVKSYIPGTDNLLERWDPDIVDIRGLIPDEIANIYPQLKLSLTFLVILNLSG